MTESSKNEVLRLVEAEKERLGSYSAVAKKCGISDATLSQIKSGTYAALGDDMWTKIAFALGFSGQSGWQVVETNDMRRLYMVLSDAKENSLFMAVSECAGGGKSTASSLFATQNGAKAVYRLSCREWSRRQFMDALCKTLGLSLQTNVDAALESITAYLQAQSNRRPLLIIDEADKLKPAAIRALIPLYNELEGMVGVVILGTENLEKEIKTGVKYSKKGYDEIDSRFGRKYIKLEGANELDVRKICQANGVTDPSVIKGIFDASEPVSVMGKTKKVVKDLRRVHRLIKKELLAPQPPKGA